MKAGANQMGAPVFMSRIPLVYSAGAVGAVGLLPPSTVARAL